MSGSSQLIHVRADAALVAQLERVADRFGFRQRSEVIRRCLAFGLREIEKDLSRGRPARVMGALPPAQDEGEASAA